MPCSLIFRNRALAFAIKLSAGSPWPVVIGLFVIARDRFRQRQTGVFPRIQHAHVFRGHMGGRRVRTSGKTRDDTLRVSEFLREHEGVVQTTPRSSAGPISAFTLVYDTRGSLRLSTRQIIVHTDSREQIPEVWAQVDGFMKKEMPWTDPIIKALRIGPGRDGKIEARFHGPDPAILRQLSDGGPGHHARRPGCQGRP